MRQMLERMKLFMVQGVLNLVDFQLRKSSDKKFNLKGNYCNEFKFSLWPVLKNEEIECF